MPSKITGPQDPRVNRFVGMKYGRLTAIRYAGTKSGKQVFEWKCDCGATKIIGTYNVTSGITKSCGCIQREVTAKRSTVHGLSPRSGKHPITTAWAGMLDRCENPKGGNWSNYGGRGITVCERWHKSSNFIEDMLPSWKPGLELERNDNSKGYSKENCRWATRTEQNRNKRNLHLLTVNGRTAPISVWASELSPSNMDLIYVRLRRGWTPEQAVTIPVGKQRPQFHGRWPVRSP